MDRLEKALCEVADILLEKHDPCQRTPEGCKHGKYDCCTHPAYYGGAACPHLTDKCNYPNIKCKTGFCRAMVQDMDEGCYRSFESLETIARYNGIRIRPPRLKDFRA